MLLCKLHRQMPWTISFMNNDIFVLAIANLYGDRQQLLTLMSCCGTFRFDGSKALTKLRGLIGKLVVVVAPWIDLIRGSRNHVVLTHWNTNSWKGWVGEQVGWFLMPSLILLLRSLETWMLSVIGTWRPSIHWRWTTRPWSDACLLSVLSLRKLAFKHLGFIVWFQKFWAVSCGGLL